VLRGEAAIGSCLGDLVPAPAFVPGARWGSAGRLARTPEPISLGGSAQAAGQGIGRRE
jgi:hypothetical protein